MTADGIPVPREWVRPDAEGVTVRLPRPVSEVRLSPHDLDLFRVGIDTAALVEAKGEPVRADALPNLGAEVLRLSELDTEG